MIQLGNVQANGIHKQLKFNKENLFIQFCRIFSSQQITLYRSFEKKNRVQNELSNDIMLKITFFYL